MKRDVMSVSNFLVYPSPSLSLSLASPVDSEINRGIDYDNENEIKERLLELEIECDHLRKKLVHIEKQKQQSCEDS